MRWVNQFALGACLGSLLDRVHIRFRIISYDRSNKWWLCGRQPIWVPPLFGGAAIVLGSLSRLFPIPVKHGVKFLFIVRSNFIWFVAAYLFSAWKDLTSRERALWMAFVFVMRAHDQSKSMNLFCLVSALIGCIVESVLIRQKFFRHIETDFKTVPAWLPFLYMHAAPFIHSFHAISHNTYH